MMFDLLLYNKNLPHQVIRKVEDKEKKSTVETDNKVKGEILAVAGGRCWKRVWLMALQKTGKFNQYFFSSMGRLNCLAVFSSENWFLPIVTLLLIVIYSAVAIDFYMDG